MDVCKRFWSGRSLFVVLVALPLLLCGRGQAQTVGLALPASPARNEPHPLEPVLRFARQEYEYVRRTVQDYTCRIVKRERLDGVLQPHHYIRAKIRPAAFDAGRPTRPLAVWLE